ncbi:MAG: SOS response-associated peptidase [Actinobacteria bacterium]|nr:SOS response-associated peptidase [Actinomycetota bacterium]
MCGRYASSASQELLEDIYDIEETVAMPPQSWNVAPTDQVPAIVERAEGDELRRKLVALTWGLVPSWSSDARGGARMINARVETVATKPAFRKAFAARRCLLPADGYYEWTDTGEVQRGKPVKQPYFIHPADAGLLAMAGIYEFWKAPDGTWLTTCSIITTTAVDALGHLHDRMPMVVAPPSWDDWLDPGFTGDPHALLHDPALELSVHPVSRAVGNVANNSPDLVVPVGE